MNETPSYKPAKIVQAAKAIEFELNRLFQGSPLATKPQELLTKAKEHIVAAAALLEEVDRDYLPLNTSGNQSLLSDCRNQWNKLSTGRIQANHDAMRQIIDSSPTLSAMHRGGLDFVEFYHFAPEEVKLSNAIFEIFSRCPMAWNEIRKQIDQDRGEFKLKKHDYDAIKSVVKQLLDAKILLSAEFEIFPYKTKKWQSLQDQNKVRFLPEDVRLRVTFVPTVDRKVQQLALGNWMTALAMNIVSDHLERNKKDFELFTRVVYQTAQGLARVSGDFDLLVRSQERILAIECKSGKLDPTKNHYQDYVTKAEQLTQAFQTTKTDIPLTFWLVYNDTLNKPESVANALAQSSIAPVTIQDLRGKVIELFS